MLKALGYYDVPDSLEGEEYFGYIECCLPEALICGARLPDQSDATQ
jgi:hypothetical protein